MSFPTYEAEVEEVERVDFRSVLDELRWITGWVESVEGDLETLKAKLQDAEGEAAEQVCDALDDVSTALDNTLRELDAADELVKDEVKNTQA
jgi:predicted transcriptional regulator